ncbi:hypothetical protein Moror_9487 [Moniliophthora roreri MCA 2997]|uniref:C2H2-type domain-containing protein n=1 Tax=Moniliophthora roreri (strain MCA 2997) TaxID=1381753 RepID=V2WWI5_MONRO|nr:hypothetical protein Moror_9487 [Moniliophthora roreri MCA 2997]
MYPQPPRHLRMHDKGPQSINKPSKYARRYDKPGGSFNPPTADSPAPLQTRSTPQSPPGGPVFPPMIQSSPSFQTQPSALAPQSVNPLAGNPYSHLAGQGPSSFYVPNPYQYYTYPAPMAHAANFGSISQQPSPSSFTAGPSNAGASSSHYYSPSAPVPVPSAAPVAHAQQAGTFQLVWVPPKCPLCNADFATQAQLEEHLSQHH